MEGKLRSLLAEKVSRSWRSAVVALAIGLVSGFACFWIRQDLGKLGTLDFHWALDLARALVHRTDPYAFVPNQILVPYPLPAAIFGLPLLWADPILAASIFVGCSAALLAFGVLRSRERWRLLVFASSPFFAALFFTQWSPLMMAAWFFPVIAPALVLVKPQVALPVALNRMSRRGLIVAGVLLAASLVAMPSWPWRFAHMLGGYQSLIAVITLPFGPLLLLAALRWRDEQARLLLAMAVLPFRALYDLVPLWLVPQTPMQALILTALSWVVPLTSFSETFVPRPRWSVVALFLPALAMLLLPQAWSLLRAEVSRRSRLAASRRSLTARPPKGKPQKPTRQKG